MLCSTSKETRSGVWTSAVTRCTGDNRLLMHIKYFGDSFDIVKQSLIRWLAPLGNWSVHPMFTEAAKPAEATAYADFLGARLLSEAVLTDKTDRPSYFDCASTCDNLLS